MDEIDSSFEKLGVLFELFEWNRVMFGIFQHSDVKISIRKPIDSISQVIDCSKDDLSIQLVRKCFEHLTFKRNL